MYSYYEFDHSHCFSYEHFHCTMPCRNLRYVEPHILLPHLAPYSKTNRPHPRPCYYSSLRNPLSYWCRAETICNWCGSSTESTHSYDSVQHRNESLGRSDFHFYDDPQPHEYSWEMESNPGSQVQHTAESVAITGAKNSAIHDVMEGSRSEKVIRTINQPVLKRNTCSGPENSSNITNSDVGFLVISRVESLKDSSCFNETASTSIPTSESNDTSSVSCHGFKSLTLSFSKLQHQECEMEESNFSVMSVSQKDGLSEDLRVSVSNDTRCLNPTLIISNSSDFDDPQGQTNRLDTSLCAQSHQEIIVCDDNNSESNDNIQIAKRKASVICSGMRVRESENIRFEDLDTVVDFNNNGDDQNESDVPVLKIVEVRGNNALSSDEAGSKALNYSEEHTKKVRDHEIEGCSKDIDFDRSYKEPMLEIEEQTQLEETVIFEKTNEVTAGDVPISGGKRNNAHVPKISGSASDQSIRRCSETEGNIDLDFVEGNDSKADHEKRKGRFRVKEFIGSILVSSSKYVNISRLPSKYVKKGLVVVNNIPLSYRLHENTLKSKREDSGDRSQQSINEILQSPKKIRRTSESKHKRDRYSAVSKEKYRGTLKVCLKRMKKSSEKKSKYLNLLKKISSILSCDSKRLTRYRATKMCERLLHVFNTAEVTTKQAFFGMYWLSCLPDENSGQDCSKLSDALKGESRQCAYASKPITNNIDGISPFLYQGPPSPALSNSKKNKPTSFRNSVPYVRQSSHINYQGPQISCASTSEKNVPTGFINTLSYVNQSSNLNPPNSPQRNEDSDLLLEGTIVNNSQTDGVNLGSYLKPSEEPLDPRKKEKADFVLADPKPHSNLTKPPAQISKHYVSDEFSGCKDQNFTLLVTNISVEGKIKNLNPNLDTDRSLVFKDDFHYSPSNAVFESDTSSKAKEVEYEIANPGTACSVSDLNDEDPSSLKASSRPVHVEESNRCDTLLPSGDGNKRKGLSISEYLKRSKSQISKVDSKDSNYQFQSPLVEFEAGNSIKSAGEGKAVVCGITSSDGKCLPGSSAKCEHCCVSSPPLDISKRLKSTSEWIGIHMTRAKPPVCKSCHLPREDHKFGKCMFSKLNQSESGCPSYWEADQKFEELTSSNMTEDDDIALHQIVEQCGVTLYAPKEKRVDPRLELGSPYLHRM